MLPGLEPPVKAAPSCIFHSGRCLAVHLEIFPSQDATQLGGREFTSQLVARMFWDPDSKRRFNWHWQRLYNNWEVEKVEKGFSNNSWKHSCFGLLKPYKTSMRSFFEAIRAAKGFGLWTLFQIVGQEQLTSLDSNWGSGVWRGEIAFLSWMVWVITTGVWIVDNIKCHSLSQIIIHAAAYHNHFHRSFSSKVFKKTPWIHQTFVMRQVGFYGGRSLTIGP